MQINISDLMAGYQDDTVELSDPGITTPERILALTLGTPMPEVPKPQRKIWRTVLIAAILGVSLIVAAVAAAAPSFYEAAFGDRGLPDIDPIPMSNDKGYSWTAPGIQWASVDADAAKALLGDYVVDIDETIHMGDYTITLGSFVMDEHGTGVLTWVIENPNGIPNYTENDRLFLTFEYGEGLCEPSFETTKDDYLISRHIRNQALSTETELYLTTYLGHFLGTMESGENIRLVLKELASINGELVERNNTSVEFPAFEPVPAIPFTDGEHRIWLSPLSAYIEEEPYIPSTEEEFWWDYVNSIHYNDGTEYIVAEDGQMASHIGGYYQHTRIEGESVRRACGIVKIFNRLVNPEEVSEICIKATDGSTQIFTPEEP